MPNVIVNFSNVSVSVAVIFVGGWLLHDGFTNNIPIMKQMGIYLILGGIFLYVLLLEYYGKKG